MKTFGIILKWSTKITSLVILALVFFIIGAHVVEATAANFSNLPETLTNAEIIASICLGALIIGTLIGLKWELIGGILTILGYIGFMLGEGGFVGGMVFVVFLLVGISNVIIYWLNKKNK